VRSFSLLVFALLGCANADEPSTGIDAGNDGAVADSGTTLRTDGAMDAIFPTEDSGPTGICATPSGTTVTANGAYMSAAESVVDAQLSTVWNSGDYAGWLRLKFPSPTRFDRVRIAANALPACDEVYTIKGVSGGATTTLATATRSVTSETKWLPAIELSAGTYDELLIEIGMSASWIAIGEIVVFESTAGCPAP